VVGRRGQSEEGWVCPSRSLRFGAIAEEGSSLVSHFESIEVQIYNKHKMIINLI
jgi:hypothetical protein